LTIKEVGERRREWRALCELRIKNAARKRRLAAEAKLSADKSQLSASRFPKFEWVMCSDRIL
jgi:hypothetical protein